MYKANIDVPDCTMPIKAARIHQAVMSSAAAQVSAIIPSLVFVIFRSYIIRASTGKAVMLIAIPMNKEKDKNETPAGAKEGYIYSASNMPHA